MTKKIFAAVMLLVSMCVSAPAEAAYRFSDYKAKPPIHVSSSSSKAPAGLSPAQLRKAYGLPSTGGSGTIAIIGAHSDATIEQDLGVFDAAYGLAACTTKNGCFTKHVMSSGATPDAGWTMETALDVEWAHAIAPSAKILLVEAKTESGANLISAIDYARKQKGVVAVSMSWGGSEFSDETTLDSHFTSATDITFFAASGDNGTGASWPAASSNVVAVGGTTLHFSLSTGAFASESAWSGSGGGVSAYEAEPAYQKTYGVSHSNGMRSIPDVSLNADIISGYSIYAGGTSGAWHVVGGTSGATPVWAAIQALGHSVSDAAIYADKSGGSSGTYFRDITSGQNGFCGYYCTSRTGYDQVTGLGSPLTVRF